MRMAWLLPVVLTFGCYRIDASIVGLSARAGDQSFPAGGLATGHMVEAEQRFTLEPSQVPLLHDLRSAHIDSVRLVPRAGVDSLAFLRSLTLVLKGEAGASDTTLAAADSLTAAADGSVLLPVDLDVDPARFATAMAFDVTVDYLAPAEAWTLGIEAALTVRGQTDVSAY
jgi:hypothetical protein